MSDTPTWTASFQRFFFGALPNTLNTLAAVASLSVLIYSAKTDTPVGWLVLSLLLFFCIALLFRIVYLHIKHGRPARYGKFMHHINSGFEKVHHVGRMLDEKLRERCYGERADFDKADVRRELRRALLDFARFFENVTGERCSTCIKILVSDSDDENVTFETLYRMEGAQDIRLDADHLTGGDPAVEHTLRENHSFTFAHPDREGGDTAHFISNRLPALRHYRNTSMKLYSRLRASSPYDESLYDAETGKDDNDLWIKIRYWPLPYKSTVVVPIYPGHRKVDHDNIDVIGFFCIDSPSMFGVFHRNNDVDLMRGISEGLYNVIMKLQVLGMLEPAHGNA